MRIGIDLDTQGSLTWAATPLEALQATRHDRFAVEVRFFSNGAYAELPAGASGRLSIKQRGDYAGPTLASATSWGKSGTGARAIYTFDLSLDTQEIEALFTEEPASIALALEIQWATATSRLTAAPVPLTLSNDYIRESDGIPAPALDLRATLAAARAGSSNALWMTPLRTAQVVDHRAAALALALGS
jgi:hypothetical protein